jgi:hypothetical protein
MNARKGMNRYLTSQGTREDGIFEVYSHLGTVPTPIVSTNEHRDEVGYPTLPESYPQTKHYLSKYNIILCYLLKHVFGCTIVK